MNIYQKMAAITADLQTVAKNLTVETVKGKGYKAVSERDILDAVKPIEAKHGIYSFPCTREILESQMLQSESEYNGKVSTKTTFFTRVQTTYRFVNTENPDEFIETTVFSEGIDSQDKGSGKAMTYADKYALMKAYKISTGDDPDQTASEDTDYSAGQKISESDADRIIKGLTLAVGSKTVDQRKLLKEICGIENVYDLSVSTAKIVFQKLLEMAKVKNDESPNT